MPAATPPVDRPVTPAPRPAAAEPGVVSGERDLRLVAGIISALTGAIMLIVPHHFAHPAYALVAPHITWWGIGFLLSGLALLSVGVLEPRTPVLAPLHVLVGATWIFLGVGYLLSGGWTGAAGWSVFGLGIAAVPFLARRSGGVAGPDTPSLLSVLAAVTQTAIGVVTEVTIATGSLDNPVFSRIKGPMLFEGISMVAAGPLLLLVLLRPPRRRWPWFWGAHLLGGACYLVYGAGLSLLVRGWLGVVLYAGLGVSLCLAPVLQYRLRSVASNSLPVRMSVFVSVALTLALVLAATFASRYTLGAVELSGDAIRSLRESTLGVLLLALAVAVAATLHTTRWIGAPLRELAGAAGKLAGGDGAAILPRSGVWEVQDLVASFAEMRARLAARTLEREQSLRRLEEQAEQLQARKRELEESYDKLRQLEELRDSLVHMVLHDLNSPLTALDALLEILRRTEADRLSERAVTALQHCIGAVATIETMVGSVLDISKMEAGAMKLTPQRCDLVEICRRLFVAMSGIVGDRRIVLDGDGAAPVTADADLVTRVVQNLLGNALKFTPREGEIRVRVRADDEVLRVSVADTGPGVPAEFHEKIFEKFGQVEAYSGARRKSTGLGLTFCKLAVEAHGGRIGVESDGVHGSTFWFTLPRS